MKINEYASDLTRREGLKESVSVAQVSEILKLINKDLCGILYLLIRMKPKCKKNQKGFAEVAVLYAVIAIGALLFVKNPISSALGVGVQPNKIVERQTSNQRIELIKDDKGCPIAIKTYENESVSNADTQQRISLWEQIRSLPVFIFTLVILGMFFPPFGLFLTMLWRRAKGAFNNIHGDTKKIVKGIDSAFATVPLTLASVNLPGEIDRSILAEKIVNAMKQELGYAYNDSTKSLVRSIKDA